MNIQKSVILVTVVLVLVIIGIMPEGHSMKYAFSGSIAFAEEALEIESIAEEKVKDSIEIEAITEEKIKSSTSIDLIEAVKKSYEELEDYFGKSTFLEFKRKKDSTKLRKQERKSRYYFKKPYLVRLEVIWGTQPNDSGSEAIYSGGKKIKGHQGGLLSGIALNINIDSGLAVSLRGHSVRDSTMDAMVERIKLYQKNGVVSMGESGKLDGRDVIVLNLAGKDSQPLLELFPEDIELKQGVNREKVYIDLGYKLPIKWELYEKDELMRVIEYQNLKINLGLPEEIFEQVKLSKEQRKEIEKLIGE